MKNLIKYEIRSNYKLHLSMYLFMILGSLGALSRVDKWLDESILLIIGLICAGGVTLALATSFNALNKELKISSKYLTYTLPVKTSSIVFSKIITGTMWINIVLLLTLVITAIAVTVVVGYFDIQSLPVFNLIVTYIFGNINLIVTFGSIYFAVVVSKLVPKLGTLVGIATFVGINIVKGIITTLILTFIPGLINIGVKGITMADEATLEYMEIISIDPFTNSLQMHIPGVIFEILLAALLIYGTIYLLDKKVDL